MIEKLAKKYEDYVINLRKELHQCPETCFNEFKTAEIIRRELDKMDIPFYECTKTGTVALIKGKTDRKTVLLRADIDALPIKEETGLLFSSKNDGFMHACGHDVHVACLLGAAKILSEIKDEIKGNIKLVFQPAEEGEGGALPMINEGIMKDPDVNAAFAMHVEPLEKVGKIQLKNGPMMACPDEFYIDIIGKGGHGSAPEQCINPIQIASEIVKDYSDIAKRIVPDEKCVVSVCSLTSGTCANVIPEVAHIKGTLRAFDNDVRYKVSSVLEENAKKICEKYGAKCEFSYKALYPPVINDEKMNEIVYNSAKKLSFIDEIVILETPSMAGDDFAYFAELVGGAYFRVGAGNDEINHPIHSPYFNVSDKVFKIGTAIMAKTAIEYLNS